MLRHIFGEDIAYNRYTSLMLDILNVLSNQNSKDSQEVLLPQNDPASVKNDYGTAAQEIDKSS